MLKIALAGLVLQGVMTIDEAEVVAARLSYRVPPETVGEIVKEIQLVIDDVRKK